MLTIVKVTVIVYGGQGSSHGSGLGRSRRLGWGVRRLAGLFGGGRRRAATDGERPATGRLVLRTLETLNDREGCARDVRRAESLERERRELRAESVQREES